MTATPIPRTVAMTVFGDLETSTLRELPGRSSPARHARGAVPASGPDYLARAWQRAREEVAAGRQVYVVCPRIEAGVAESDGEPALADSADGAGRSGGRAARAGAAVESVLPELGAGPLAGLRLAGLTGRMTVGGEGRRDGAVRRPARPDGIDVLVATTVIEVGVDIPNATLMIVLDADRFGVSQLHQLRGRVGRGSHAGLCLLVTESPEGDRCP